MNCIVFYNSNTHPLTGSLINAFEYFLCAYEYNREVKLILCEHDEKAMRRYCDIVDNRYDLSGIEDYKDNMILTNSRMDLYKMDLNSVLVLDFWTIHRIRGFIRPKKLTVISEKHTDDPRYFFKKSLHDDITYYGEMPFHYRDKKYRMKMLFNRYKPLKRVDEGIYVNSPLNNDYSFLDTLDLPQKPIIKKTHANHLDNMYEKFDTYLYYHANKWFDPHPRLFVESTFYNKEILYYNIFDIKDGSYYRYHDVMENGIEDRTLTKDDEIVRILCTT